MSENMLQQPCLPDFPLPHGDEEAKQGPRAATSTPRQLGLTTDSRRLFGALATGWLHPLEGNATQMLSVGGFARERELPSAGHRIAVRLCLNPSKLPNLDAPVLRNDQWVRACLHDVQPSDDMVQWLGAIPAFAISALQVCSSEERSRLVGMSRQTQNLDLSDAEISIVGAMDDPVFAATSPSDTRAMLEIPPEQDAIHGALTMAVWAVPRIDPWMNVLQASIESDLAKLAAEAAYLEARWWQFPPWRRRSEHPETLEDCLWLAAMDTFQGDCNAQQPARPRELLVHIAERAAAHGGEGFKDTISAWQENTSRVLRADTTIQLQGWRENPVGLAIQLVLTRPEPDRFKTWFKGRPDLPPGVAWSAATLCGLLNGYKKLPVDIRGCALQRELLAVEALSTCSPRLTDMRWPCGRLDLRWRREPTGFVLSHKDKDFARKAQKNRGKWWYAAKFGDAAARREALDAFCRFVAVEDGVLPAPPAVEAETHAKPSAVVIPGLVYEPNFLDEEHEQRLVDWIDAQEWSKELERRVQHYGWRYDYKARGVDSSMQVGALPALLADLAQRLYDGKLVSQVPDQVIVNEYTAGQGIAKHIDAPKSFADGIATISLLESWEMAFHLPASKASKEGKARKVPQLLERRSVAVLHDDARWKWQHEIAKRKTDPPAAGAGKRRPRERRISLTFRKVLTE